MPSPRPHRSGTERSLSFNGRAEEAAVAELRRPRTVPDLRAAVAGGGGNCVVSTKGAGKLTKVLVKVTIQGSVGGVQVLMSQENTVSDLIMAVVKQYGKEGRRPVIMVKDVADFDLHYSQFSLQSLDREEKLEALGSRNFFMCKSKKVMAADAASYGSNDGASTTSSCSKQAAKQLGSPCPWLKFMSFLSYIK